MCGADYALQLVDNWVPERQTNPLEMAKWRWRATPRVTPTSWSAHYRREVRVDQRRARPFTRRGFSLFGSWPAVRGSPNDGRIAAVRHHLRRRTKLAPDGRSPTGDRHGGGYVANPVLPFVSVKRTHRGCRDPNEAPVRGGHR